MAINKSPEFFVREVKLGNVRVADAPTALVNKTLDAPAVGMVGKATCSLLFYSNFQG